MRTAVTIFAALVVGSTGPLCADDPKPAPKPSGVILDLRGPPDPSKLPARRFTITYTVTFEGPMQPDVFPICYGGRYEPTRVAFEIDGWATGGYVAEKAGDTHIRLIGRKDKNGKLHPVIGVTIESKDLPAEQLPKVVPDAKNKG